ncbi:MAG: site-specific integrase [Planktothrix rubescens PR223]|jgi:site-specific recombinase XerD
MSVKLREKLLKDGRISLYLDIYDQRGKRSYETLYLYLSGKRSNPKDKEIREQAERVRLARELSQLNGEETPLVQKQKSSVCFFQFLDRSIARRRVNSHLKAIKKQLREFTQSDSLPIGTIDRNFILSFQEFLLQNMKNSTNTASGKIKKLRTQLEEAKEEGLIPLNPFSNIPFHLRVKYKEPPIAPLTPDEIRLLMQQAQDIPAQIQQCFYVSLFTGLRWSDASELKKSNIQNVLIDGKRRKVLAINVTKGEKPICLPLSKEAIHYLAARLNDERKERNQNQLSGGKATKTDYIFPRLMTPNKKAGYGYMRYHLLIWAERLGMKGRLTYHLSRHSFATMMLPLVGDIRVVQKLLGHADIATTQRYAHVLDSYKASAVDKLSAHNFLNR